MSGSDVTHSEIECPKCHSRNSITVNAVSRDSSIDCSKCGNPLGSWKDLGPQAGGRHSTNARLVWNRDRKPES